LVTLCPPHLLGHGKSMTQQVGELVRDEQLDRVD